MMAEEIPRDAGDTETTIARVRRMPVLASWVLG